MNLVRTLVKQRRGGPEARSELDVRAFSQVDRAQLKNLKIGSTQYMLNYPVEQPAKLQRPDRKTR